MHFTINNTAFIIDHDEGQWYWASDYADSDSVFLTAYQAQQDAMRFMRAVIDDKRDSTVQVDEDAVYGSYEQQVSREYNHAIRH